MNDTKKERLEKVFEYLRGIGAIHTKKDFALAIKHNYTNVTSAFNGNEAYLTDGLFEKINNSFPIIDTGWLQTGIGNMTTEKTELPQVDYGDIKMIPLLPLAAQGGSLNEFIVSVKADDCEKIVSPIKGVDFAMTVSGDSMEPEYPSGAKILLKKINERAFIEWGRVYVLDTCNGSVIKKIMPGQTAESVTCVSLNQHYPSFEVSFADMFGMYRVLMLMSEK